MHALNKFSQFIRVAIRNLHSKVYVQQWLSFVRPGQARRQRGFTGVNTTSRNANDKHRIFYLDFCQALCDYTVTMGLQKIWLNLLAKRFCPVCFQNLGASPGYSGRTIHLHFGKSTPLSVGLDVEVEVV